MKKAIITTQLGKNGVTKGFIERLKNDFKYRENVKVELLKLYHDKNKIKEIEKNIIEKLGKNFNSRIVGFCIFLKKSKKPKGL